MRWTVSSADGYFTDTSLDATGVGADVVTVAYQTLGDEGLTNQHHGHFEQVGHEQLTATDGFDTATAIVGHTHHHTPPGRIADGDDGANGQINGKDGTVLGINDRVAVFGATAEQAPTAIA